MSQQIVIAKPVIVTLEIEGHKLRSVEARGLVCVRDILDAIDVGHAAAWIEKLNVLSKHTDNSNVVSNNVALEYFNVGQPKDAAFTNEPGIIEILAGSRKPIAKIILRALIDKLRARASISPDIIKALTDRIEQLERGGRHLLLQPIPDISARARLNMIIRRFVAKQEELGYAYSYPDAWRELYYQHKYRYHEDLRSRARNRKCDPLDCASPKELEDLVNLAGHIFIES